MLAPFVSFADTLAKAKRLTHFYSVALLLEKWFACLPTSGDSLRLAYFRLFSDKRGKLAVYILFFFAKKSFNTTSKRNSLLPSFLSGEQNRNDDRRKNIM